MATLKWRPRFTGADLDITGTLPVRPWTPSAPTIGGRRTSAAGIPASYVVRRDDVLWLRVRFKETDWPDVRSLIAYGQSDQIITWYPDASNAADSSQVYLEHPAAGEDADERPSRDEEADWVMEHQIALRSVDGSSLWRPYFAVAP